MNAYEFNYGSQVFLHSTAIICSIVFIFNLLKIFKAWKAVSLEMTGVSFWRHGLKRPSMSPASPEGVILLILMSLLMGISCVGDLVNLLSGVTVIEKNHVILPVVLGVFVAMFSVFPLLMIKRVQTDTNSDWGVALQEKLGNQVAIKRALIERQALEAVALPSKGSKPKKILRL